MIRDVYRRCYVAPTAYTCAVPPHNNRADDASSALCGCAPRLCDSTNHILFSECSAVQLRVQLWSVNQQATEAEGSPLLRFITRKCLVKILQRNSHCEVLLPSKDE
jgi:hypothetical protein